MRHTREEVIERTTREFEALDRILARLTEMQWNQPLPRRETKDPWTVKDGVAHLTHWKADMTRRVRKLPKPKEERGLDINDGNRLVYERWKERSPEEVLDWHRQVHEDTLKALREAPEEYFSGVEHNEEWPYDFEGHYKDHRVRDIERAIRQ